MTLQPILTTVHIGSVASDNSAYGRVHLIYTYKLGENGKPVYQYIWYHFSSRREWNDFFKLWHRLEKPFLLRLNPATHRWYPAKISKKGKVK